MNVADGPAIRALHEEPPEPGEAIEIAEGILWMRLPLPLALDHVNVYALDEGDGWCLVDTGFDTKTAREIWQRLLKDPLAGRRVKRLFATHHHPDHVGLAGWFYRSFGTELLTTRTAWLYARMLTLDVEEVPSAESLAYMTAAGVDEARLAKRRSERPFNFSDIVAPMPPVFTRLQEGQEIGLGGRRWTVHCGNGHAPEHATLWEIGGDLVIAGDQILPGISPHLGIYTSEPDADPVSEWLESCARFRAMARPGHRVLPGHKLPFTGLAPRLEHLIENHRGALDRLEVFLHKPRSAPECFLTLFKREIRDSEYGLALSETLAHLNSLRLAGRAMRETTPEGVWRWQARANLA